MKEKILKALDCALEDLSEERLLDILLDAYKAKSARIESLEAENAREREQLRVAQKLAQQELNRLRTDPFYWASGEYFFFCNGKRLRIAIRGSNIQLFERIGIIDYEGQRLRGEEWSRTKTV